MRLTRSCSLLLMAVAAAPLAAQEAENESPPLAKQRFRLPDHAPLSARVTQVDRDGKVTIQLGGGIAGGGGPEVGLTEGHYLAVGVRDAQQGLRKGGLFLRVRVNAVLADNKARLQVDPEAVEKFEEISMLVLMRPPGSTTRQIKAAPAVAPIVDASNEIAGMGVRGAADLETSKNNLKQIGLALHNFHDVYNRMPPAVIYGPDGKPWHSWRVLILPFIEEADLYNRYRWDEPWDGPNNSKLLKEMPELFRDPAHGERADEYYTHYAGVAGQNSALATGAKFDGTKNGLSAGINAGYSFARFIDGLSNSLMAGSISPDRKIPWMKPEDVTVGDDVPGIGTKDGFAAPYEAKAGKAGVFLRCDGSVLTICTDVDKETFRRLLLINDRQVVSSDLPTIDPPRQGGGGRLVPVLEIHEGEDGPVARLTYEIVPRTRRGFPGTGASVPAVRDVPDGAAADEGASAADPPPVSPKPPKLRAPDSPKE